MSDNQFFRSNGKLLITGEYLVLKGATSLSIPTKKGQSLQIKRQSLQLDRKEKGASLQWITTVLGKPWFKASFCLPDLVLTETTNNPVAKHLQKLLLFAKILNPYFLNSSDSFSAASDIEFDINWGLGSSSSLLVNIASWAGVQSFDLHFLVSEGSGYDVASCSSDLPIIYHIRNKIPQVERINFYPSFHEKIFFVYLGNKRSSNDAVKEFNAIKNDYSKEIEEISAISYAIANVRSFSDFVVLLQRHEEIISGVIKKPSVPLVRFPELAGTGKSLGAWGGDFVMLATEWDVKELGNYLHEKGVDTWFRYSDLILPLKK